MIGSFRERLFAALRNYLPNMAVIWLAILVYRFNPFYQSFLRADAQSILLRLALCYTFAAFPVLLVFPIKDEKGSRGSVVSLALFRLFKRARHYLRNFPINPHAQTPTLEEHEKASLLFLIVKIYFLPIMLNFFLNNYFDLRAHLSSPALRFQYPLAPGAIDLWFKMGLTVIFAVDTLYFAFGYAVEWPFLKNKVKSVEPTMLGWAVALLCYPPFNDLTRTFLSWYPNDMADFGARGLTVALRIAILLLLLVYIWATVALGAKCSNLTNRGIVTRGPYRFVRHPAYAGKVLSWWLTILPFLSLAAFISMLGWTIIYYLRAITEERHLIGDDAYQEYCRRVKYRFLPGIW